MSKQNNKSHKKNKKISEEENLKLNNTSEVVEKTQNNTPTKTKQISEIYEQSPLIKTESKPELQEQRNTEENLLSETQEQKVTTQEIMNEESNHEDADSIHVSVSQQQMEKKEQLNDTKDMYAPDSKEDDLNKSFESSISNWSQLVTVVKKNPRFQICQQFVNSLGQKIKVYVDVEGASQFLCASTTPLLQKASETKASTFEYASLKYASTLEHIRNNEYVMFVGERYTNTVDSISASISGRIDSIRQIRATFMKNFTDYSQENEQCKKILQIPQTTKNAISERYAYLKEGVTAKTSEVSSSVHNTVLSYKQRITGGITSRVQGVKDSVMGNSYVKNGLTKATEYKDKSATIYSDTTKTVQEYKTRSYEYIDASKQTVLSTVNSRYSQAKTYSSELINARVTQVVSTIKEHVPEVVLKKGLSTKDYLYNNLYVKFCSNSNQVKDQETVQDSIVTDHVNLESVSEHKN